MAGVRLRVHTVAWIVSKGAMVLGVHYYGWLILPILFVIEAAGFAAGCDIAREKLGEAGS